MTKKNQVDLLVQWQNLVPLTIYKNTFFKPEHVYCKWKLLKDVSPRITPTWPNKKSKVMCVLLPLHLRIFRCVKWWKAWDRHVSLSILGLLGRTLRNFLYPHKSDLSATSLLLQKQTSIYIHSLPPQKSRDLTN